MRISDWSSDVCSSDLTNHLDSLADRQHQRRPRVHRAGRARDAPPVEPDMSRLDHRLRDAARARDTQEPQQLVEPDASCGAGACHECVSSCRSEEHTSALQSLMRISYDVFCLKNTTKTGTSTAG